jgi:ATP-dependent exoDNAse (exonuclease V) beta subunit
VYGLEVVQPDPVEFGANVHRALLAIHEQAKRGKPVSSQDVDEIIERVWVMSHVENEKEDAQARKAAARQLKRYVAKHLDTFQRIERVETSFSFGLCGAVLTGKIDLIRRTEDDASSYEIVDFKAGKDTAAEMEQVEVQLSLYAQGAERYLGLPVTRRVAHFLESDRVVAHCWSPATADAAQVRLETVLNQISTGEFKPRTTYCAHCSEFRPICPYATAIRETCDEEVR